MTKIVIDPSTNIPYGSFYIKGLVEKYGLKNISFKSKPFKGLPLLGWNIRYIIIKNNKISLKVFIHTNDSYHIEKKHYEWCDIYGNVNFKHYPHEQYSKQISLVPSFGIKNFNFFETIYFSISNFSKSYNDILKWSTYNKFKKEQVQNPFLNIKRHFLNYLKNYLHRADITTYLSSLPVKKGYVFFLSTLWYSDEYNNNDDGVNLRRANFITACKAIDGCTFDGGLLVDSSSSKDKFIDVSTEKKLKLLDWIKKTKESEIVFNTPAFWDCHGWKLGEYLVLGKAIISTPLSNDLPVPLIHGKHLHFIQDSNKETIIDAINFLLQNTEYRQQLERNAREYWIKNGSPIESINRLHSIIENKNINQ